ncbi:IclR family transcriptional regulator [Pseudonocardia sp. NPDC049154]|uniref:IclR family transcriptional regulator n=1 Tax=Pseudonocardia sp. NPDC049154 TaxID=3155501 RepID=UPI0033D1E742
MSNTERHRDGGVQSVDRAITVLEILARRGEAGVSEVAAELDVHKSTAFRLLGALEDRGLVEQATDRGKYTLGFGLIPLAGAVSGRLDVTRLGREACERLAQEFGETVNIAVLQDRHAVNVHQARGPSTVLTYNWIGRITPLHCTSSGKALIAWLDPADLNPLLKDVLDHPERFTKKTLTTRDAVVADLGRVRATGYAVVIEEYEIGLNAVGAPIRDQTGGVAAALSLSGPSYRLPPERLEDLAPTVVTAARDISRRLGWWDQE